MPCPADSHSCRPPEIPLCRKAGSAATLTYAEIVRAYLRERRQDTESEHRYWASHTSRSSAVRAAALSELANGKRHSHQWRISGIVLQQAADALAEQDLPDCQEFHDLLEAVDTRIRDIHGIGELAVYDIAHRIGAFLGLRPEYVYLHAGTREGARALGLSGAWISVRDLPTEFHELTPSEAEDCLCIYKDSLARAAC